MSRRDHRDVEEAADEVVRGRRSVEGTWTPDWVAFAVSPSAHSLYHKMRMRINHKRGDSEVWPGRASMAVMHGVSTSDPITPLLKELVDVGAIDIKRERMPRRNVYVIHDLPPTPAEAKQAGIPGYTGPMTIEEWDRLPNVKLAVGAIKRAEREKREKAKKAREDAAAARAAAGKTSTGKKPQVSPDTGKNRYLDSPAETPPPDTGKNRYLDTGKNRYPDTGKNRDLDTGKNQHHSSREPQRNEPPPPPPPRPGLPLPGPAGTPEEEGLPTGDQMNEARGILDVVQGLGGCPHDRFLVGKRATPLVIQVAEALRQGWTRGQLVARLSEGTLADARSVYAVLQNRIDQLGPPPPPPPPPPPALPGKRGCEECEDGWLLIEVEVQGSRDPDPRPAPCPSCRPQWAAPPAEVMA